MQIGDLKKSNFAFSGESLYIIAPDIDLYLRNFDIVEVTDQASLTSVTDTTFVVACTAFSGQITVEVLL